VSRRVPTGPRFVQVLDEPDCIAVTSPVGRADRGS
jgi:hypothetical protein